MQFPHKGVMNFKSSLLSCALALSAIGLSACTVIAPEAQAATETVSANNGALFGDYLAGQYANELDDAPARAKYFGSAFDRAPDDIQLGRLAMVSHLNTGEHKSAVELAARVIKKDKTESMARALLGVDAFIKGRNARATRYLEAPSSDVTMSLLMSLVEGWNKVDRGSPDAARKLFSGLGGADYFSAFGQLQIAKLELSLGELKAADAALNRVEATNVAPVESTLTRARYHLVKNDREAALEVLKEFVEDNDAYNTGPVSAYLAKVEAGESLGKYTPREQAARALTDPSFAFFYAARSVDGAEVFLRFARQLDPDYDKAVVWLGALLEDTKRVADAADLYQEIDSGSPYYVSARLNDANILFADEKDESAMVILEKLNETNPSFVTREALGRARFFRENYAEALPFYDDLVTSMSDDELEKNTEPLRLRAIAYERTDQWPKAEADFKRVLSMDPDNVDTLNYLGYTWVDRGENLNEAFEMIRKAVDIEPTSGAIVDSLGWAHYKLGQYGEAKVKLERAVELSPSSATIIDHLGDVYWKLGRLREAGYQWQRALEFDPTDEERANIKLKLKGGLDAVKPQP